MFQPKYVLIRRAVRPVQGIGLCIESVHWFKRTAERRAQARAALQASQDRPPLAESYTWEVDTRCA